MSASSPPTRGRLGRRVRTPTVDARKRIEEVTQRPRHRKPRDRPSSGWRDIGDGSHDNRTDQQRGSAEEQPTTAERHRVGVAAATSPCRGLDFALDGVVQTDVDQISFGPTGAGGEYWFGAATHLPPPPEGADSCVGRYLWAKHLGALDAENSIVQVTISDAGEGPVVISGFQIHVVKRLRARPGVVASCGGRGSGPAETRLVMADLDREPPSTESFAAGSANPDPTFTFTLSRSQSQVFDITARTTTCYCEWEGRIDVTVGDRVSERDINNDGRPFKTMADERSAMERFLDGRWHVTRRPIQTN
jgi:hypothetical protein